MKKSLFIFGLALLGFNACDKSEENVTTTYQIINNTTPINMPDYYEGQLDGTLYEIIVYCYIGDDIARQDNINAVKSGGGTSQKINVENNYDKVKMSFKFLPKENSYYNIDLNARRYVQAFSFLTKGENTIITINDNTMIGTSLKSNEQFTIKKLLTLK
jgi:hypothetical protein